MNSHPLDRLQRRKLERTREKKKEYKSRRPKHTYAKEAISEKELKNVLHQPWIVQNDQQRIG